MGGSDLTAGNTTFDECVAGAAGGALAVMEDSTATLQGTIMLSGNSAEDGGAIFAQGLELHFTSGTFTIRDNRASGRGGGILSWAPVYFRGSSARLVGNHAESGGGWCGISHEAVLSLAADAALVVQNCTATRDGGGIALLDLATLVFESDAEPCRIDCRSSNTHSCKPGGLCLSAQCNFNGGLCNEVFEEAGLDALQPCNRETCSIVQERDDRSTCGGGGDCLVASCDWAEASPPCRQVLDSLRSCPLFDAVAYHSILRQGSRLTYVKEGGTAGGFGRCVNASCQVAQNGSDSYEWCQTVDDAGRLLEQTCENCWSLDDLGESWGVCSPGRPRLPSAGFDYDAALLLELLTTPVENVIKQVARPALRSHSPVQVLAASRGCGLLESRS
eukprot:2531620-Rhodomonas_salina.1